MGGMGKGGGSSQQWGGFSGGGGGGGNSYAGGGKNVGAFSPGGGKAPSYNKSESDSKAPSQAPQGGGKAQAMTPESIAMMKSIAKYAALGAIAGPGGTAAGGAYGAWKENRNQKKLMEGAEHISATQSKRMGGRASAPGSPLESNTNAMKAGRPGYYRQPATGGSGSLLGGDEDQEGFGGYGSGL